MRQRLTRMMVTLATSVALLVPAAGSALAQEAAPRATAASDASAWSIVETQELAVDGTPLVLSPDGQWIAGTGSAGDFCVWEVASLEGRCDGDDTLAIDVRSITWSPGSDAVAFSQDAARRFIDSDIFLFELATGELVDLTDDDVEGSLSLSSDEPSPDAPIDIMPTWSPDGTTLAFSRSDFASSVRTTTLVTIARDGGDPEVLSPVSLELPFVVWTPMHWTDAGLFFTTSVPMPESSQNALWLLTEDRELVRVLDGDREAELPTPWLTAVSADGEYAAVYSLSLVQEYPDRPGNAVLNLEDESLWMVPVPQELAPILVPPSISAEGVVTYLVGGSAIQLAIADPASETVTYLELDDDLPRGTEAVFLGLTLASNDTIFIPGGGGTGTIVTLAHEDGSTPIPPCSCTPPTEA